jgi:hypothetical protein
LIEADTGGNPFHSSLDNPIHYTHILGKSASGGLESGSDADPLIYSALGVKLSRAIEAVTARNVVKHNHAVAGPVFPDARAALRYNPGGLVTVNARRRQKIVLDLLQIGMTNPASLYAN